MGVDAAEIRELDILAIVLAEPVGAGESYRVRVLGWPALAHMNAEFPSQRAAMDFAVDLGARYGFHLLIRLRSK